MTRQAASVALLALAALHAGHAQQSRTAVPRLAAGIERAPLPEAKDVSPGVTYEIRTELTNRTLQSVGLQIGPEALVNHTTVAATFDRIGGTANHITVYGWQATNLDGDNFGNGGRPFLETDVGIRWSTNLNLDAILGEMGGLLQNPREITISAGYDRWNYFTGFRERANNTYTVSAQWITWFGMTARGRWRHLDLDGRNGNSLEGSLTKSYYLGKTTTGHDFSFVASGMISAHQGFFTESRLPSRLGIDTRFEWTKGASESGRTNIFYLGTGIGYSRFVGSPRWQPTISAGWTGRWKRPL